MKKILFSWLLGCSINLIVAQPNIDEARKIIQPLLKTYPGISIAISNPSGIIWQEGFGYSNIKQGNPVNPETKFRYYSLSKSITGIALAKLIEENKLSLEASVRKYLPDLPDHYEPVTIAHLISHTGGVRHYKKNEWMKVSLSQCESAKMALAPFINDPLQSVPGTQSQYSSFGYVLLSAVIESVSQKPYGDYLKQILGQVPLSNEFDMDQTEIAKTNQSGHYKTWNGKTGKDADLVNNSCKFGGGGLVGTARSLAQIHQNLLGGFILNKESMAVYYKSFNKANGESVNYAFGLGTGKTQDGLTYYSHSGSALGANGIVLIYPEKKIVLVMLGNLNSDEMNSVGGKIARLFMN